jgi:hypothetical protein
MSTSRGALMELVAKGTQDLPLIGNPQMTYFKQVYKRHTNFSRNSIQVSLDGGVQFGTKLTCKIPRSGDLLYNLVLELDFPELTADGSDSEHYIQYIPNVGFAAIDYVDFKIQGTTIDKQYGEWMYIWSQLSHSYDKRQTYDYMTKATAQNGPFTAYIPLQLWFCRNYGSALPIVALQYHDVELDIQLKPLNKLYYFGEMRYYDLTYVSEPSPGVYRYTRGASGLSFNPSTDETKRRLIYTAADGSTAETTINNFVNVSQIDLDTQLPTSGLTEAHIKPTYLLTGNPEFIDIRLFADYIFLDTYEQKHFAQNDHRYLIEQVQFSEDEVIEQDETSKIFKLKFNLPIKELIWIKQINENYNNNLLFNFEGTPDQLYELPQEDITGFTLKFNNEDRIQERNGEYFRLLQPLEHHTNVPKDKYIYLYSFSLYPEDINPSGASNFSKIDKVNLIYTMRSGVRAGNIRVYGLNYNILRIENGMGGVAFAN